MGIVFVGIGGALGALSRYGIGRVIQAKSDSVFPFGTFAANLIGPLLLGVLVSLHIGGNVYMLLGDGFLGAFTTLSTFMFEEINLFKENEKKNAVVYITTTLILGLAGYFAGYYLGGLIAA